MKESTVSNDIKAKPFLRWAGGKRWLVKHFETIAPNLNFENYHEPFVGSGVLFFHINPIKRSYLSDLNEELIETYKAIKDSVSAVVEELGRFKNNKDDYYKIRASNFKSEYKRAARFIYLNQTSFNGIYRVNLNGQYNVPYGFRDKNFFDPENLKLVSTSLQNSILRAGEFDKYTNYIKEKDLVFLDPPYTVSHNYNGFIKYNQKLFSLEDQYRLSSLIDDIKAKKAFYILTNAAHKKVEEIFEKGDRKIKLSRASLVGGANAERGKYEELIFTNIQ